MRWVLVVVTVVTLGWGGQWSTVNGQVEEEPPIVGPGPCSSDTPWGCFAHRVWLPVVMAE